MTEPFMPTADLKPETEIKTTWGVIQGFMSTIKGRDAKIADLEKEIFRLREYGHMA